MEDTKRAKVRISINEKHLEEIETQLIVYNQGLGIFAYEGELLFAARVENMDGSEYYIVNMYK